MKPLPLVASRQMFPLVAAIAALLNFGASSAFAVNYYWDSNGTTSGLGNTAGTWGSIAFQGTVPNVIALDGTASTANTATTNADAIYFGTNNLALGNSASTIGIVGTGVTINTIVFGTGQGSQGVTLSGGGGAITLAGTAPSATPTIGVNNTGTNIIGAVLTGTAGMVLTGPGTLQLTGAATYTGTTTIQGGSTLRVGNGTTGNLFNTTPSALTFSGGGGTINFNEAAGSTQSMGALTFSTGDGNIISTAASGSATQTITFASLVARTAGATGNFNILTNTTAIQNKITLTSTTNAPVSGSGSNDRGLFFGGMEFARYDTVNGYFRAVSYGSDNNASAIIGTGSTLGINDATKDVKISGDITAQTTASVNTLNLAASNLTLSDTSQILSVNGILSAGASSASIATAGKIQATSNGGEIVIRVNGASDGLSIAPTIQNAGASASALTKSGAGTLTLSGTNTYTGTTFINGGTMAVSGGSAIVDTGAVALANTAGAVFQLNNNETIGSLSGGGFSGGNVNVGANTLTIANANNQNFSGQFIGTGSGAVNITTGTLTLGNKNTFAGTINLNGGTLALAYGNDGTSNPAPLSSGGTINMAGGTFLNLVPAPNVAGGVGSTVMSTGSVSSVFGNGMSISNPIVVTSGTATIQSQGATGANDWKWNFSGGVTGGTSGTQTLAINQGAIGPSHGDRQDLLFSGVIANGSGGTLGVSVDFKSASATAQQVDVNLSGQNTFTGPIVVSNTKGLVFSYAGPTGTSDGGYLGIGGEVYKSFTAGGRNAIVGTGYLGAGANYSNTISLATGTALSYVSSANQILGGVISGGGNLVLEASSGTVGSLTLNAQNTFTGVTIVNSGILKLGDALSLQNSAFNTTNSTTGTSAIGLKITTTSLTLGGLLGNKNFASIFETNADGGPGGTTALGGYSGLTALTLNPQSGSVTYTANIADATTGMTLTKTGAGTQVLSGTNTYTGGTTVTGGILQFGKLVAQPVTGAVAVGTGGTLAVSLGGTGEWTTGTSGNGTIGGLLTGLGGQSGGTVTYSGTMALGFDTTNGVSTQTYASAIGNAGTALGITKLGTNTLFLTGNNTYSGATTVNAGTLVLIGTNSYTGGSSITGGTLQFAKLTAQPASGAVAVSTGGTLAVNLGGTGEWTTGTSGNGTIGGLLAGLGGQSGGTVTYSGAVALGFDTTNATGTQTYSNAIANVGTTLGVTKLGTGTLVLSGVNTYTGATTVNGGTLLLDKTGTGGTAALASTSALVLGGGNFQMLGKTSGTTSQTLGALTLTANRNNTITLDSNGGTGTTLTLANSGPTRGVGSSLLIDRTIANTTLTSTLGLTAAAQTTTQGILGYALVKDATGIGFAANVSGSIVRYTGADTTFSASSNSATTNYKTTPSGTSTTGSPYISGSVANPSFNSLYIDTASATGANFLSLNGTVTLTQRALLMTGNNNFTIQSGTLGSANSEVIVHQTGSGTLTISSLISSGTGSLTKDGTGTLIVTNASNAYSGGTTLNAGTLQYASKTAFGTGTLYLSGGTKLQKITEEGNNASLAMANNIVLSGGQVELNVDFSSAKDQWYSGIISGTGSLRVTASGGVGRAVTLTGNNTFTGGVTLDTTSPPGWIQLGNANALGTGTLTINHTGGVAAQGLGANTNLTSGSGVANNIVINTGATFNLGGPAATGNVLLSGVISGSGSLNKSDAAATTFILSGTNTYTGSTTISTGTLQLDGSTHSSSTVAIGTSGTLTGTGTVNGNATLTGNGVINKSSGTIAGTLTVTGGNWNGAGSVGGAVASSSGTFTIGNGANLTATSGVTATGGTVTVNGTLTGTLAANSSTTINGTGTITGNATIQGIHNPGNSPGIQTFGGDLAYTGGASVVNWELSANTVGNNPNPTAIFDQIMVGGDLDFTDLTTLNLAFGTGSVLWTDTFWDTAQSWVIYDVAGTTTNFGNLTLNAINWLDSGSNDFNTARTGNSFSLSQAGNDVVLNYNVVPEPRAALLGGLGLLALLRRRRG